MLPRRPLLAALLLLALLPGCARREDPVPPGRTLITVWSGWTGHEQGYFQAAVKAYNRSQNRIFVKNMSTEMDDGKLLRALTAGVPPDLFFLWEPSYIGALAANNAIQPLDLFIRKSTLNLKDLIPGSINQGYYEGHYYAMPFLIDAYGLYWSKKAFREVGLDPERPPRTMSELEAYTKQLLSWERPGQLRRLGFEMPGLNLFMVLFGGRFYDPATKRITTTDPRNVEALAFYKRLYQIQGGAHRIDAFKQGFGEYNSANHQFFVGKVAMMISGQWWSSYCRKYRPGMDFGVAPLPYPDQYPGLLGTTYLGGNFACIPTESKHPRQAWDFLRWMQTYPAQLLFAQKMRGVPNYRPVLSDPSLTQGDRWSRAFGVVCQIANHPNARFFPALPVNLLYMNELDNAAQYGARGRKTPYQALADVEQRVQQELEKYPEYRIARRPGGKP